MDRAKLCSASLFLPFVRELRCMVVRVDPKDGENPSMKSSYHWKVLKCRSLINELPEIIASPTNEADCNIYIVTTGDFLKTGKVRSVLGNMNVKLLRFAEVTRKLFEACLKYTVLFHVAPAWNRVDANYLLRGRDFLTSNHRFVEAIKLNVVLIDDEARFIVSPASVELPRLTLEYFSLSKQEIKNFITSETGSIQFKDEKSRAWVRVLPSLKKGRVMSVSKRIPESSPFPNYRQLRRHWKNMYGYRLPENETGLIYYQVYFPWAGEDCYTYPNHCLSPAKIVNLPLDRPKNTAEKFLNDLAERMPKIFGTSLKLEGLRSGVTEDTVRFQEAGKENIPDNRSSIAKNLEKIWKLQATPWKIDQQQSCSVPLAESDGKNETVVRSSQSVKGESDESTVANLRNEDKIGNDEERFSLLRSRSSFDFIEFSKTLDGRDPFDETISGDLTGQDNPGGTEIDKGESDGPVDDTGEIKSRFFDNLEEESSAGGFLEVEKKSNELKLPLNRVKLHRLSDRKLQGSAKSSVNLTRKDRRAEINFKTRDISSYFIQKKVKTSRSSETDAGSSAKSFDQPQSRAELIGGEGEKE